MKIFVAVFFSLIFLSITPLVIQNANGFGHTCLPFESDDCPAIPISGTISNQHTCEELGLTWLEPDICQVSDSRTINDNSYTFEGDKLRILSHIKLQVTSSGTIENSQTIEN